MTLSFHLFSLNITSGHHARLRELSTATGRPMAELVRAALDDAFVPARLDYRYPAFSGRLYPPRRAGSETA